MLAAIGVNHLNCLAYYIPPPPMKVATQDLGLEESTSSSAEKDTARIMKPGRMKPIFLTAKRNGSSFGLPEVSLISLRQPRDAGALRDLQLTIQHCETHILIAKSHNAGSAHGRDVR